MKSTGKTGTDEARQYNIVLIMTDQQPLSTLGCYGNPHNPTPNLDELAASGLRFDNFYIAGFPCGPSRGSLMTGRHSHSHGVVNNEVLLEPAIPSLGQILTTAGYDMAQIGKWHLGGQTYRDIEGAEPYNGAWGLRRVPSDEGFKFEKVKGGGGEDESQHGFNAKWVGGWKHYKEYLRKVGLGKIVEKHPELGAHHILPSAGDDEHCYSQIPEQHHVETFLAQEAIKFINQRKGNDTPFGLVLSFYGPHLPVAPPRPWDDMFSLDQVTLPNNHYDTMEGKPYEVRYVGPCYMLDEWSDEQFKDYIRRYWGFCAYIDKQVGLTLDALSEAGLADDTIVIFTTDHGDMMGAHGMVWKWDHSGYEEILHIPFIMRVPGVTPEGAATSALVSNIDILPTLLELVGVDPPAGIQGRSLLPVLSGQQDTFRDRIFCDSSNMNITTYDGRWKYVLNWQPRDIDELYDLENEPGEMNNLIDDSEHQEIVRQMQEQVFNWLREAKHPYGDVIVEAARQSISLSDYPQAQANMNPSE